MSRAIFRGKKNKRARDNGEASSNQQPSANTYSVLQSESVAEANLARVSLLGFSLITTAVCNPYNNLGSTTMSTVNSDSFGLLLLRDPVQQLGKLKRCYARLIASKPAHAQQSANVLRGQL